MRKKMRALNMPTPSLIADGSIDGPGSLVVAIASGADACMSGEWLVAADESISAVEHFPAPPGKVLYRGMASKAAIKARSSERYGKSKTAPEGKQGYVKRRGSLGKMLKDDLELIKGGFSHSGAGNIEQFHEFGDLPYGFCLFTGAGQNQIAARVDDGS